MFIYSISTNKETTEEDTEVAKICFAKDTRILPRDDYVELGVDWVEVGNVKRQTSICIEYNTNFIFNSTRRYRLLFHTKDKYTRNLPKDLNYNLEAAKQWLLIGEAWFSLEFCLISVNSNQNKTIKIYIPPGYVVKYNVPERPSCLIYKAE